MRKFTAVFIALFIVAFFVDAAVAHPVPAQPIPVSKSLTAKEVSQMSVKEFQKVTGKKLNVMQKLAYKTMQKAQKAAAEGKSQLTALLLCWLVGIIGVHRFYLGYTWQGIVQILTLGGLGIWTLIDLIRIITGSLQPKDGTYEKTL